MPGDPVALIESLAYGANNEQLPERFQDALRRLVLQFSTESESTRRQEIRRIKQAHQFWRGLQYLWWNERDQNWHLPFEQKLTEQFVDRGFAALRVRHEYLPGVRAVADRGAFAGCAARAIFPVVGAGGRRCGGGEGATEVAALVERNNRIGNLIVDEAFNLWTDGKVGAYVRFVVDGQRFGFHPETEIGMRESADAAGMCYVCPECGAENRASGEWTTQERRTKARELGRMSGRQMHARTAACGALLTEEDFVAAETITVPAAQTRLRVPNGQEVITIVGGLELKTPPWANEMHEYPYLQWNMEVHQARLRAAYPHAADKIGVAGRDRHAGIRAPRAARAVAGRAAHRRRRLQYQPDHVSAHLAASLGVFRAGR